MAKLTDAFKTAAETERIVGIVAGNAPSKV
jgi:hypothetical protein